MIRGKTERLIKCISVISLAVVVSHVLLRVFVCDSFIVSGHSMEPTFNDGRKVWAFKPGIGARIYTRYDFSDSELHSFRVPGFRRLKKGDIAVFNHPYGWDIDAISFRINHVLIKRCAAVPGDTVRLEGVSQFYVPGRGDIMVIDTCAFRLYRHQIEFETGKSLAMDTSGRILLDGKPIKEYSFKSNWYFFVGDNKAISIDSRQFGLVPGQYIVGRVL